MTLLQAAILGIVEGISEFLPISSTAHLILTSALLHIQESDFVKTFEIAIQLGAICAAIVYYWRTIIRRIDLWPLIFVAFLPTAVIGLAVHSLVKKYFLGNVTVVLWSLLLGGFALILFERWHSSGLYSTNHASAAVRQKSDADDLGNISYRQAALIGMFQAIAIIPGVSRSAATIVGGLLLGVRRRAIIDFSFLLAIPTMIAATALDLWKSAGQMTTADFGLLGVGFLFSFVVALLSIVWLLNFIRSHSFAPFGIYRIFLSLLFFGFLLLGILG